VDFKRIEKETIKQAFPQELEDALTSLFTKFEIETKRVAIGEEIVVLGNETVRIPSRIYWTPPTSLTSFKLTSLEKDLLNCIFTRHSNGFVRQEALKNIINSNNYWVTPFILLLAGEYVLAILEDIYSCFDEITPSALSTFILQNPIFYNRIKARIQSYWNCYYRIQFPEKIEHIKVSQDKRYVGFRLIDKLEDLLDGLSES